MKQSTPTFSSLCCNHNKKILSMVQLSKTLGKCALGLTKQYKMSTKGWGYQIKMCVPCFAVSWLFPLLDPAKMYTVHDKKGNQEWKTLCKNTKQEQAWLCMTTLVFAWMYTFDVCHFLNSRRLYFHSNLTVEFFYTMHSIKMSIFDKIMF